MVLMVMGILFQVPIGILAVTRVGIVSTGQLRRNRRYAILVIAVAAMLLPGQDPVTMLLMMAPLIVLFEGSILMASLLDRRAARVRAREEAEHDPADSDGGELVHHHDDRED
jgi:sec-independent protein translocase protein TatC